MAGTKEHFSQRKDQLKEEFSQHFGPLYKNKKSNFISFVKQHPNKSFLAMLVVLCLNFFLMVFIDTNNVKKKDPLNNMKDYITKSFHQTSPGNNIEPTFSNIIALRAIQDSLKYFSEKNHLVTHEDTILLKGLLRKYAIIDPSIFKVKDSKIINN